MFVSDGVFLFISNSSPLRTISLTLRPLTIAGYIFESALLMTGIPNSWAISIFNSFIACCASGTNNLFLLILLLLSYNEAYS
jgi:hypothetical protein